MPARKRKPSRHLQAPVGEVHGTEDFREQKELAREEVYFDATHKVNSEIKEIFKSRDPTALTSSADIVMKVTGPLVISIAYEAEKKVYEYLNEKKR